MKKMIALLLCLLGSSFLWAQENTVLGTGALAQAGAPKYAIKEINITNPGSYNRPTIDFGGYQVTWDYLYMWVGDSGLSIEGIFKSPVDLNGFMPSIVGGHGNGATLQLYFFAIDSDGNYLYEIYNDASGSGYAPTITLSPMTSLANVYIQSYIDDNNQLRVSYSDYQRQNVYNTPPTVNISFGGATAVAVLDETALNSQNTAIGYEALYSNANGRENTALGHQSLKASTGNSNIGIGYLAGNTLTTGNNNLFIGNNAGKGITTGSGNLILGGGLNSNLSSSLNNSILMADGSGNPKFLIRDNGSMKVGYGTDFTPTDFKLDVNGIIRGTTAVQAPRVYAKDVGFTHPQSSFYLDFLLSTFDTNTLDMRAIVNPNDYRRVFIIDRPSASVTFYAPVKGANAVNNNEFATLGQVLDLSAANNSVKINTDGNVGIGTSVVDNAQNWNKVLQVHGDLHAKLLVTENTGIKVGMFSHIGKNGTIGTESQHDLTFIAGYWNEVMTLRTNGNVGIGIKTPQEKLAVNGKIRAREVKVEPTDNWPDYVFEESYKPMSLAEISAFVKRYKHLPEVPSAKEVAQNGLELGEMNKVLLKKIEELTLHLIEKDQQLTTEKQVNKQQGEEIATLQQQYEALKKLIEKAIK